MKETINFKFHGAWMDSYFIMGSIDLVVTIFFMIQSYQYTSSTKKSYQEIPKSFKLPRDVALSVFICRIIACFAFGTYFANEIFTYFFIFNIFWFSSIIFSVCLQIIKLYYTLKPTQYKQGNKSKMFLTVLMFIFLLPCLILIIYMMILYHSVETDQLTNYDNNSIELSLNWVEQVKVLLWFQCISCILIIITILYEYNSKFYQMTQDALKVDYTNEELLGSKVANKVMEKEELLDIIGKQVLLNVWQSVWIIFQVCAFFGIWLNNDGDEVEIFFVVLVLFEVVFALSLWLSFTFAEGQYDNICICCHKVYMGGCKWTVNSCGKDQANVNSGYSKMEEL